MNKDQLARFIYWGRNAFGCQGGGLSRSYSRVRMERITLKYLLDTAPWINVVLLPDSIPNRILELIASDGPKGLCAISLTGPSWPLPP